MKIELKKSEAGNTIGSFTDGFSNECLVYRSTSMVEPILLIATNRNNIRLNNIRLNVEMAEALIPLLQKFVETGGLD